MKPVWGVINHHDRSVFEVHLFSDRMPPSAESGYPANPLDHVYDARGLSNADLASLVTRTGIDILVDLNGYSFQSRLGLFMRRPAPVIIGWFNMYATSGIDAFDYIIGDAADRLLLDGPAPHKTFLAAYARVDIALDTFPYNGGTTTMEALWQGVPVLTFNGDRSASRQSRSLLLAAGLEDWCLPDRLDLDEWCRRW